MRSGLDAAAVLWPKDLRKLLKQPSVASLASVMELATRSLPTPTQATALCLQLRDARHAASQNSKDSETFSTEAFWRLKASFTEEGLTDDGSRAFGPPCSRQWGGSPDRGIVCGGESGNIEDLISRINKDPRAVRAAVVLSILPGYRSDDHDVRPLPTVCSATCGPSWKTCFAAAPSSRMQDLRSPSCDRLRRERRGPRTLLTWITCSTMNAGSERLKTRALGEGPV